MHVSNIAAVYTIGPNGTRWMFQGLL